METSAVLWNTWEAEQGTKVAGFLLKIKHFYVSAACTRISREGSFLYFNWEDYLNCKSNTYWTILYWGIQKQKKGNNGIIDTSTTALREYLFQALAVVITVAGLRVGCCYLTHSSSPFLFSPHPHSLKGGCMLCLLCSVWYFFFLSYSSTHSVPQTALFPESSQTRRCYICFT